MYSSMPVLLIMHALCISRGWLLCHAAFDA